MRIYTIRSVEHAAGEMDSDIVQHAGESMPGANWAVNARLSHFVVCSDLVEVVYRRLRTSFSPARRPPCRRSCALAPRPRRREQDYAPSLKSMGRPRSKRFARLANWWSIGFTAPLPLRARRRCSTKRCGKQQPARHPSISFGLAASGRTPRQSEILSGMN